MLADSDTLQSLSALSDQCVKCGLCLPACPSYALFSSESDSPRGRIALIQGLVRGDLADNDASVQLHLDRCLSCGACETACPSGVRFLSLLDQTKAAFALKRFPLWRLNLFSNASAVKTLFKIRRFIPNAGVSLLPQRLGRCLAYKAPDKLPNLTTKAVNSGNIKGRIAIFSGCVGKSIDENAMQAFSDLLATLNYDVFSPATQTCCGAMHLHEGYAEQATNLLQTNLQAFNAEKPDAIVYFASGCGAHLSQYAEQFNSPVVEATAFISSVLSGEAFNDIPPPAEKVAIHSPCTLRNQTHYWPDMLALVKRFAAEQLLELPDNALCCGSAGLHMLKRPHEADRLLSGKLDALDTLQPDILLTANTGCNMHFQAGITGRKLNVKVMHPIQWLAKHILDHKALQTEPSS